MPNTDNFPIVMDIDEIKKVIPHRYPFLLIDRIIEYKEGESITSLKNVTANEPFFQGHFPEFPVMPGVLIVEAMAQTGAVMILKMTGKEGQVAFFAGIDKVRFKKQVRPGDQLVMKISGLRMKGVIGKAIGEAYVDGKLAVKGELMFALQK